MNSLNRRQGLVLWLMTTAAVVLVFCAACQNGLVSTPFPQPETVLPPLALTETASGVTQDVAAAPTPTLVVDTGWLPTKPGIERRVINMLNDAGNVEERFFVVRVDPTLYQFNVAYSPGEPLSLQEWLQLTKATMVVNGGFFTDSYEATGLTVVDGVPSGSSYTGFGGMFLTTRRGPELRWLAERPYDPSEPIQAGLQSFPMLIRQEGGIQTRYENEGDEAARRTVVAQDTDGRVMFVIALIGALTLDDLSLFLIESDLKLVMALNLDGGASSGLLLSEPAEGVNSFSLLPTVITVHALE